MFTLFLGMPAGSFAGGAFLWLAVAMAFVLLLAMAWDAVWGEPPVPVHPVVWMGKYLGACGRVTVRCTPPAAFMSGALAWFVGALAVGLLAGGLQALVFWQLAAVLAQWGDNAAGVPHEGSGWPVLLLVLLAGLLKTMLSWRMLREETSAVEAALQRSLQAGRERLAMLVSRDTSSLTETEVRESAIESLAENLNDSVVAPIFWFVLFGLPGAAVYRFANTADAMWGYRGLRNGIDWEWAGKWAARADDALSWLPARITALLLARVAGGVPCCVLRQEARKTPSPNSGWPMAAMALGLGVQLHKPGVYVLNAAGRVVQAPDTLRAQKFATKVVVSACLCALPAIILIAFALQVPRLAQAFFAAS